MILEFKNVCATLTEDLLGTVPKNAEIYAAYIATKAPKMEQVDEEIGLMEGIEEKKGWSGFHSDEIGPFMFNYQVKGFLKEAGVTLAKTLKIKGIKSKIEKFVIVGPRRIYLPDVAEKPLERPIRAFVPGHGEIVSVTRSDVVKAGSQLHFRFAIVPNDKTDKSENITAEVIEEILNFGVYKGLGQWRSGGYGTFEWTYE